MFSALKTLRDIAGIIRGPSLEERIKGGGQVLLEEGTKHNAKCTLLIRRELLPHDWSIPPRKVTDEQWDELNGFHERMLKEDPDYKKEYLAEVELQRTRLAELEAAVRQRRLDRERGRLKE